MKELGLEAGSTVAVDRYNYYVLIKKVDTPNVLKEFKRLQKIGISHTKKKGIKNEGDIFRLVKECKDERRKKWIIDTNVFVSALYWKGNCDKIVQKVIENVITNNS
ncbi:MAG: hypothetical protein V1740_01265 [Candidatus Woesearchaeota archaeon]